jgi:hypothetical protein
MKVLLHGYHDHVAEGFTKLLGGSNVDFFYPPYMHKISTYKIDDIDSYDLVAFGADSAFDPNFNELLEHRTSSPKIFIDEYDDFFVRNIYRSGHIKYYFKRELYSAIAPKDFLEWSVRYLYGDYIHTPINMHREKMGDPWKLFVPMILPSCKVAVSTDANKDKLLPYPLTLVGHKKTKIDWGKKDIDLSYILRTKRIGARRRYFNYLASEEQRLKLKKIKLYVKPGGVGKSKYEKMLARSKAGVSLRGYGYDTFRYWEIAAFGGVIMSQNIPLIIPNNFVDGESALFFNNEDELQDKFQKYIVKSDEWKSIGKLAYKIFYRHHTPEKRVKELILEKMDL